MSPTATEFPRIDVTATWGRFNEGLIRLVDYVPDDKLNWSPKPELWNFRGILLHIAATRYGWMSVDGPDGEQLARDVWQTARSKTDIQEAYRRSWDRLVSFLGDESKLAGTYDDGGQAVSGHWIAYHLLEHDIHHRADILHYLALLDVQTPDVGTP
jgi:uncharacterized damage-inducible protein DinB